ncbi:MAG: c-type cytochrome [Pirellulaceae bacterium]|nr:c-type cytochrome [Pirellulaceae bacterium]
MRTLLLVVPFLICIAPAIATAADGNRLAYLDGPLDPYYPHKDFPKLITPQWVGEPGVECVVTLAIDDMRDTARYEAYLRPILERLKKIDGRAPVSIMTCKVDPADPQLQTWLREGLSIECHTFDHPCPCLTDGGLAKAKETYDKCVDLLNQIPGNRPVAFRMPCCDSKNTPSPRLWAEVFNKTTAKGNFLQIDSSVMNIITSSDTDLPAEITTLPDGSERFARYVPFKNFVNTIRDYPYPYVIGGMCWEFPCVTPSDWSAQHVQKPNNPDTVRDWKLALDAAVIKQGTFNLVFHPHGWIRADQIIELIDHAVEKHGKKVKFLTFKECAERLNKWLLDGVPLRDKEGRNHVLVADFNDDSWMDVDYYEMQTLRSVDRREWNPKTFTWIESSVRKTDDPNSYIGLLKARHFKDRLRRDIDGDGKVETIRQYRNDGSKENLFKVTGGADGKHVLFYAPRDVRMWDIELRDAGLRLIDINSDGKLDCLFSNSERYSLHLFKDMKEGWSIKVIEGVRGKEEGNIGPVIPPFVRADGTNNGAWFHSGALWLQNEDTWRLPDGVFKLTFKEMLAASAPPLPLPPSPPLPKTDLPPPKSPDDALKSMHLRPGMRIELVAAEPLVVDPVAFDWGPDGRLWVVEMRDYPNGIDWRRAGDRVGNPGGRVKVLTDTDGDGKYDKASVFLDKLPFPTGIKVWRKGAIITAAPEILYAEDTTGDDVADERRVLYRGFGEGNQQHRVNGLRWGLDGWLYVGNGDSGGVIRSMGSLTPTRRASEGPEINIAGRDLRIGPDTGEIEAVSGQTQFGRDRDDFGNWFGGNNSNPMWHYVLDDHYLRRNPHFAPPPVRKDVSQVPGASPVFPRSQTLARFNDPGKANRFTSACSPMIYRDELLGPEFAGNSFVCEPVHNLVHREVVSPQGVSFTSRRADDEQTSEFLASDDNWFRPSMVRTGPDGALWVSDMYRFVIEHPKWIPEEFQQKLDLRAGDDRGRIYRIYPDNSKPRSIARLDKLDTAGLVAALDSPNGPQRDLAQQMLIWRGDKAAVPDLEEMAQGFATPQQQVQALWTLHGLQALDEAVLLKAMSSNDPHVLVQALCLAEPRLAKSKSLTAGAVKLADRREAIVRLQAAYSLGACSDPLAAFHLANLLVPGPADPYMSAAVMSSLHPGNVVDVLAAFTGITEGGGELDGKMTEALVSQVAIMGSEAALGRALSSILVSPDGQGHAAWQFQTLGGALDMLARRNVSLEKVFDARGRKNLDQMFAEARTLVRSDKLDKGSLPRTVAAIHLLSRGFDNQLIEDAALMATLLQPRSPAELQAAAVGALGRMATRDTSSLLLAAWPSHSPALRQQILDLLTSREDWSLALLEAIEQGQIPAQQIDARRRQQFATATSEKVRQRAEKVLAAAVDPNRQKLVSSYLKALGETQADATRGKAVFAKRCANCHKLDGVGHAVGPDLAALNSRTSEVLLTAILDPNRAVEDRYLDYLVLLADGRTASGMLREETGTSITLAGPEGKTATILRSEIDQLKSSGKSLMPEGVEKDITPADMADLAAYLQASGPPPKSFPGNQPAVVRAGDDGSLLLLATQARILGPTLIFEAKYRNLGYWRSAADQAQWSPEVAAAGKYRLVLDYACDQNAGGKLRVSVAGQTLTAAVPSTGSWDDYRPLDLGTITLPAGACELVVQSEGPIKSALIDLRGVRLVPVKD